VRKKVDKSASLLLTGLLMITRIRQKILIYTVFLRDALPLYGGRAFFLLIVFPVLGMIPLPLFG
jgi:hypothetical protein